MRFLLHYMEDIVISRQSYMYSGNGGHHTTTAKLNLLCVSISQLIYKTDWKQLLQ